MYTYIEILLFHLIMSFAYYESDTSSYIYIDL